MQLCSCPCISSRWSTRALHGFRDVLASSKLGFADARWISTIQRVRRQGANAIETTKPSTNSAASSLHGRSFRLAVIGAGPAGFYATSRVLGLAESDNARVDMYEELPVPFGLVRYGVAPDHPEVKNCIHKFEDTAQDARFRYFGNVQVGGPAQKAEEATSQFQAPSPDHRPTRHALSIPTSFLRPYYDAILLTYGASLDRSLGPSVQNDNANLENVMSARSFVHWYNGHPHSPIHRSAGNFDLSHLQHASIIGQGNVALDCARILLSGAGKDTSNHLQKTDLPQSVLESLSQSGIRKVDIVGRRGPLQFAGTTKELRELVTLASEGQDFTMTPDDMQLVEQGLAEMEQFQSRGGQMDNMRMKKRLLGLMQKASTDTSNKDTAKGWSLSFCKSPIALYGSEGADHGPVKRIDYELNDLSPASTSTLHSGDDVVDPSLSLARGTGRTITQATDLVLKSVGYRSIGIQDIPFDARKGVVTNNEGRVLDKDGSMIPGLYVSGWLARGPNGVIATTMYNAFDVAANIVDDFIARTPQDAAQRPPLPDLCTQGFGDQRIVSWQDWQAIDAAERARGAKLGKEREKFVRVDDMLAVLG